MSNIELFEGGVPAYLKSMELDDTTKALMGGGASGKRISIRGSVFRMIVDGKEVAKNDSRSMNMVFIAAAPNVARQWFEHEYVEGETTAPTCFSHDGKIPDPSSEKVQSKTCATCPQNIKGSGRNGGRACAFLQRVAVVLENDIGGDIYQLSLPSMSIFGDNKDGKMTMQGYAKLLGSNGVPITAVVTEAKFDTDSSVPKLTFRAIRPLTPEEITLVREQGQTEDAQRAVEADVATLDTDIAANTTKTLGPKSEPPKETPASKPQSQPTKRAAKATPPAPKPEPVTSVESDLEEIGDLIDEELSNLADWDD